MFDVWMFVECFGASWDYHKNDIKLKRQFGNYVRFGFYIIKEVGLYKMQLGGKCSASMLLTLRSGSTLSYSSNSVFSIPYLKILLKIFKDISIIYSKA